MVLALEEARPVDARGEDNIVQAVLLGSPDRVESADNRPSNLTFAIA